MEEGSGSGAVGGTQDTYDYLFKFLLGKLCLGGMYMSKGGEDMSFLLWSFVLFTKPRLATVNKAGNRLLSHRTLI